MNYCISGNWCVILEATSIDSKLFEKMQVPALLLLIATPTIALASEELSREQLKPLTAFRQQHRRAVRAVLGLFASTSEVICQVDGRLCAAAFVQERGSRWLLVAAIGGRCGRFLMILVGDMTGRFSCVIGYCIIGPSQASSQTKGGKTWKNKENIFEKMKKGNRKALESSQ